MTLKKINTHLTQESHWVKASLEVINGLNKLIAALLPLVYQRLALKVPKK